MNESPRSEPRCHQGVQSSPRPSPGQDEVHVGVVGAGPGGGPLDGVDLLAVGLQVVDARVLLHGPDLQRHVVRTRGQQVTQRVPLDGVHLVLKGDGGE